MCRGIVPGVSVAVGRASPNRFANYVIPAFDLAIGFELFTVPGLLGNRADHVGRYPVHVEVPQH